MMAIIAGTDTVISGSTATGGVRRIPARFGSHTAGSIVTAAGCWLKGTGSKNRWSTKTKAGLLGPAFLVCLFHFSTDFDYVSRLRRSFFRALNQFLSD